jgi:hypothetical protein
VFTFGDGYFLIKKNFIFKISRFLLKMLTTNSFYKRRE